jgi:hypothetical protein
MTKHVTDWEKVDQIKRYSKRMAAQEQLVGQWMDHPAWQAVVFGQLVQGKLTGVNYACDVVFTLDVPHGNKTLHIEGPYEEFLPVADLPSREEFS